MRARVPADLKQRVARVYERYGVAEATLLRDALEAVLDYIERGDGYRRPIRMGMDERMQLAAEDAGPYETKAADPPKGGDKLRRRRGAGPNHPLSKAG